LPQFAEYIKVMPGTKIIASVNPFF